MEIWHFPCPIGYATESGTSGLTCLLSTFFDLELNLHTRRESRTRLGKTIANGLSYPNYLLAMLGTPFVTSNAWILSIAEGLCVVSAAVSAISQLADHNLASRKPIQDAYRELARIRDRFEDLWFYVDGDDSGEPETQMLLGQLTSQFTELQYRCRSIRSKYAMFHRKATSYINCVD